MLKKNTNAVKMQQFVKCMLLLCRAHEKESQHTPLCFDFRDSDYFKSDVSFSLCLSLLCGQTPASLCLSLVRLLYIMAPPRVGCCTAFGY